MLCSSLHISRAAKIAESNFAGIVPLSRNVDIVSEVFMDGICASKCLLMMSSGLLLTIADTVSLVTSGQWWISGNSFLTSPPGNQHCSEECHYNYTQRKLDFYNLLIANDPICNYNFQPEKFLTRLEFNFPLNR